MRQKILLIDDDPYALAGIRVALKDEFELCHITGPANLERLLRKHRYDLVILDLDLKEAGNGLDLIATIQRNKCKVLVLTTVFDHESIAACLKAKVNGFVPKRDDDALLLGRVKGAIAGYNMTDPGIVAMFTRQSEKMPRLGYREMELIDLAFLNPFATNAELADRMDSTPGNIGKMFHKLYIKFQVNKRAQLLAELRKFGYRPNSGNDTE
jgi:DNA-binding NarL/FixJ family response regulator